MGHHKLDSKVSIPLLGLMKGSNKMIHVKYFIHEKLYIISL